MGAVGQGIVAGDLVNTASRIQGAAAPGTVLVDEATRRMTEAAIVCEPAGSFELKGKPEPVALWRAVHVSAARRGVGRSAGLDPPFVGRERELRLLKDSFHATEGGRAHLVSVSGIAGIGKSRLAWEFEKYADGLADEVLWHRGRCLSYGEGVAFWALAEMVRMRARIAEDEPAATAAAKLEAVVHEWVTDVGDRDWVMPPLRHLLGLAQIPDGDRERLFPAWRRFFEAMAERLPVVLVFEDMQWADEALLSFVEYLMEWSRDHRLFVIALARPEMDGRRAGWAAASRSLTSLALEPLPREAMVELVVGMVPGLPPDAVARIAAAAEGVPLYAVETARMLLDRGVVVRADDGSGYRVTGAIAELQIPESLHALVAARLDGLPEDDRRLVQQAAVLGKAFSLDGLAAVSGLPRERIEEVLTSLARKELVAVQTDPRSPERGQYGFVQDMVRTIARDTLGRRERKRLHLATAEHLTRLGGDELAEVIAAHRVDAYRLLPDDPDAAKLRDDARAGLLRAADRAGSLAAPAEAYRLVTMALDLVPDGPEQADLHERAGTLALQKGDVAEAEGQYTRALEIHERAGDAHSAARVRARRGDVLFLEGRAEEAVVEMEEAYAVLADGAPDADLAHLGAQVGRLCGMIGDEARGRAALERAIDIAEMLRLPERALKRAQHEGPVDHRVHPPSRGGALPAARVAAGRARGRRDAGRHARLLQPLVRTGGRRRLHAHIRHRRPGPCRAGRRRAVEAQLPAAHVVRRLRTRRLGRGAADDARGRGQPGRRVRPVRPRHPASPAPIILARRGEVAAARAAIAAVRLRRVRSRRAEPGGALAGARRGPRRRGPLRRGRRRRAPGSRRRCDALARPPGGQGRDRPRDLVRASARATVRAAEAIGWSGSCGTARRALATARGPPRPPARHAGPCLRCAARSAESVAGSPGAARAPGSSRSRWPSRPPPTSIATNRSPRRGDPAAALGAEAALDRIVRRREPGPSRRREVGPGAEAGTVPIRGLSPALLTPPRAPAG